MAYQNNQQNGPSVNTPLTSIFSEEAMLNLKAWNRNLSLEFALAVGKNPDGVSEYDQDQSHRIRTTLTYEKCLALTKAYDEVLRPAIEHEEANSISVDIRGTSGDKKALTLGYDGKVPFIRIAWGIKEGGEADPANNVITMHLRPIEVKVDYNIVDGSYDRAEEKQVDLDKFVECMRAVGVRATMASHAIRFGEAISNAYAKNRANGNYAGYGRAPYGGNGASYGSQSQYNPNNAFMPSGPEYNLGSEMDALPFK